MRRSSHRKGPCYAEGFAALEVLYRTVDRAVAAAGPICRLSGFCCDFPRSGEVLYATALETAWVLAAGPPPKPERPGWCPYYRRRLCTLRARRPLGCRLYFCDPHYRRAELPELSAWAHQELKRLHEGLGLPYRYAPFLTLLEELTP